MQDMYFVSEAKKGRGGKIVAGKCINIGSLQEKLGPNACNCILVVHALGGCDSTSAIFGLGKGTIFNRIIKDSFCHIHCSTLQYERASLGEVCAAGINLLVALYGGKVGEPLSHLRYTAYCSSSLSQRFQAERLPPSESAARFHAMRVHLQAVIWGTLGACVINPTDWGWKLQRNMLLPIQIDGEVAPKDILRVVRCKCKSNCSSGLCSCRKHGIQCVSACDNCHGTDCSNIRMDINDDSDTDSEHDSSGDVSGIVTTSMPNIVLDDDLYFENEEEV